MTEKYSFLLGSTVDVKIDRVEREVTWRPILGKRDDFARKVRNLKYFNGAMSRLDGLTRMLIRNERPDELVVDYIEGLTLEGGNDLATHANFLRSRNTKSRVYGAITYLRMVQILNNLGKSFVDHKLDSVIFPYEDGNIAVIDCDSIESVGEPAVAWQKDVASGSGLKVVLGALFTGGLDSDYITYSSGLGPAYDNDERYSSEKLTPPAVVSLISQLNQQSSAGEAANQLSNWLASGHRDEVNQSLHRADEARLMIANLFENVQVSRHHIKV